MEQDNHNDFVNIYPSVSLQRGVGEGAEPTTPQECEHCSHSIFLVLGCADALLF